MGETQRYLVFLLDGAADWSCESLGNRTPLEAANTPTLDQLARDGAQGRLDTIPAGCAAGSEVANLCILSYDPRTANPGRGVLESASMGVELSPAELALRANLITIDEEENATGGLIADHSAGHITSEEARDLIVALDERIQAELGPPAARLHPGVSYRHLLVLSDGSPAVACTPPHDELGQPAAEFLPRAAACEAEPTAMFLRELIAFSRTVLPDHPVNRARKNAGKRPANCLWPWAPGRSPDIASFRERHGVRGAVISAVDLVRGIGRLAGMSVLEVEGATGLPDTNYEGKADAAVTALEDHEFVYVHIEGTDEAGHAGDPALKRHAIECCDERLIGRALTTLRERGLSEATRIAVLPDHFTPCELRTHDGTPVPFLLWGPGVTPDATIEYSEQASEAGSLGLHDGLEFVSLLLAEKIVSA